MKGLALVTGAAKRIGRAIALDLAAHGWDIVVHYRRSAEEAKALAEEIQALGQTAYLAEIDLSNVALAEKLIPSLVENLGPLDALVNNAALFEPDDEDPDGTRHWAVNADAPRLLAKSLRGCMTKSDRSVIVNLLDATPTAPNFLAYGKSKDFLKTLTVNMAKSFTPQIRVNGVAPMYVFPSPRQTEDSFRKRAGSNIVAVENVAACVRQLIESPAITGEIVSVG